MKPILAITFSCCLLLTACASWPLAEPVTQPPGSTNIVGYVPAAWLTNSINATHAYEPLLPPPGGLLLSGILGALTIAAGTYANIKTQKLKQTQAMLNATITGVETAGTPETKAAIQTTATAAGVQSPLDALVQELTRNLPTK